jgi:hypothetical protein
MEMPGNMSVVDRRARLAVALVAVALAAGRRPPAVSPLRGVQRWM